MTDHPRERTSSDLFRFVLMFSALYVAFGVASPFIPEFLSSRGLAPEQIGSLLSLAAIAIAIKGLVLFAGIPAFQALHPEEYQADLFPDRYDLIASNLIEGNGYRFFPDTAETTIRTPGFVLALRQRATNETGF